MEKLVKNWYFFSKYQAPANHQPVSSKWHQDLNRKSYCSTISIIAIDTPVKISQLQLKISHYNSFVLSTKISEF